MISPKFYFDYMRFTTSIKNILSMFPRLFFSIKICIHERRTNLLSFENLNNYQLDFDITLMASYPISENSFLMFFQQNESKSIISIRKLENFKK